MAPSSTAPLHQHAETPLAKRRRPLGWRGSEAFVTLSAAFAIFTDTIAYDIVIPFLPQLFTRRLKTPPDQVARWTALTLEAFGLTQLLFAWISGFIVDRSVSKSAPMITGLVVLLFSTLLFFLGTTESMIVIARGVQGASSGLVWVSAMAFLVSQVDNENIGECMGYTTLGLTVGELTGPLLGGSLYDTAGHWVVFFVMSVIVLANLSIRLLVKEVHKTPIMGDGNQNESGNGNGDGNVKTREQASEADPLLRHERQSEGSDPEPGNASTSISSSNSNSNSNSHGCRQAVEDDGREAVEGLRTLGLNCISSIVSLIVVSTVRFGFEAVIPLFVFRHFLWSSSASGAVMSCLLLPNILGPVLGKYASRHGPRWYSSVALMICGIFLITLCFLSTAQDSSATRALFILNITTIGIGIAATTIAHGTALSVASPRAEDMAARAQAAGRKLSWRLRLVKPGIMMSGLSSSWAVAIFLGPTSADLFHFGTSQGFMRLCLFWSTLCMATGVYSLFSWRKW